MTTDRSSEVASRTHQFVDEAAAKEPSDGARVFVGVLGACVAICAIMGTIKLGMVLFS